MRNRYFSENHLISSSHNDQLLEEYVYDGDGKRVLTKSYSINKVMPDQTAHVGNYFEVLLKGELAAVPGTPDCGEGRYCLYLPMVFQAQRQVLRSYHHADGVRIAVRETPGQVSWLYGDHLGSTSVTANAQGVMTSQTLYKAWEGTGTIDGRQGSEDGGMCVSPTSIYLNFFTLRQPRLRFRRFHPKGG